MAVLAGGRTRGEQEGHQASGLLPTPAPLALGTGHLLRLPVHRALLRGRGARDLLRPAVPRTRRTARVMPGLSWLWTSHSALLYAASTQCSRGASSLCFAGPAGWGACTAPHGQGRSRVDVAREEGAVGSHVSLTCPMEPVQDVARLWR